LFEQDVMCAMWFRPRVKTSRDAQRRHGRQLREWRGHPIDVAVARRLFESLRARTPARTTTD
jgi:hypothetical protein